MTRHTHLERTEMHVDAAEAAAAPTGEHPTGQDVDAVPTQAASNGSPQNDTVRTQAVRTETVLTEADIGVLVALGGGLTQPQIARRLGRSPRTIRRRLQAIRARLGVRTPVEAVAWAARNGFI